MTPANDDFWGNPDQDVPEPPKPTFADVPDKAWVLVKNATREQKEGAQPKIATISGNDGDWYKFKTAFIVSGGGDTIKDAHAGKYIFWEANTHRHPEKDPGSMPCGGQLYNLILDTLAPAEEPTAARWTKAHAVLATKAKELDLTPATCNGDTQYLYARVFKEVLLDKAYQVIGQTYTPKKKEGKTFQPGQTLGSITSDTTANRAEHKIKVLGDSF